MQPGILTLVDEGKHERPHVDRAIELAEQHDATLHGIFIIDAWRFGEYTVHGWDELVRETQANKTKQVFSRIQEKCQQTDVDFEPMTKTGKPLETILSYARANNIEWIVVGHPQGLGGILHSPKMIERLKEKAPAQVEVV